MTKFPTTDGVAQLWSAIRDLQAWRKQASSTSFGGTGDTYFALPVQPVASGGVTALTIGLDGLERAVTSTSGLPVFYVTAPMVNRYVKPEVSIRTSDASTAGQVWLVADHIGGGPTMAGLSQPAWTATVTGATSAPTRVSPAYSLDTLTSIRGQQLRLAVYARRSAGSGTVYVSVPAIYGAPA